MEGDYLELSQFPYNSHPFPYNSRQSPLGTTGFLTTHDCCFQKKKNHLMKLPIPTAKLKLPTKHNQKTTFGYPPTSSQIQ